MYESFVVGFLQVKVIQKKKYKYDSSIYFTRKINIIQAAGAGGHGAQAPLFLNRMKSTILYFFQSF